MNKTNIEIKGNNGENWVMGNLMQKGYHIIKIGHLKFLIDLIVIGQFKIFAIQVKNKEPRIYYPDTGLEKWRFLKYKELNNWIKILILFTEKNGRIYGDWIDNLEIEEGHGNQENKIDNCEMVYWWIKNLKELDNLLPPLTN